MISIAVVSHIRLPSLMYRRSRGRKFEYLLFKLLRNNFVDKIIAHADDSRVSKAISSVCDSVCVFVCTIKPKRLKVKSPNLAQG